MLWHFILEIPHYLEMLFNFIIFLWCLAPFLGLGMALFFEGN